MNKLEAGFREGTGEESCGNCRNFFPPDKCQIVEGTIASNGLCDLYAKSDNNTTGDLEALMGQLFGGPQ